MKKRILVLLCIVFSLVFVSFSNNFSFANQTEEIDYTESLENFDNPERGFYRTYFYNFLVDNNRLVTAGLGANLIHLRLNLGNFSKAVNNNADLALTTDMLNTFDAILKTVKKNGGSVIIRFAYDGFNGKKNLEPSLDMILTHIKQISPVLAENKDVISYVELGFFGPFGEMHSSDICNYKNVSLALDTILENTPDEIKVGVRHPGYYTAWAKVDRDKLNENITIKGTKEYRVGIFNDGYLGSLNDLGTFKNREIETSWISNQATHTLYGGEAVDNYDKVAINTVDYIAKEGFVTHTTYLNYEWNQKTHNAWRNQIYNGIDSVYKGQNGYLYVENHLGYRYVLRSSKINPKNKKLNINLDIENVGFANMINSKVVSFILKNEDTIYEIPTDLDVTTWMSQKTTPLNITLPLNDQIKEGNWQVYLRISKYGDYLTDNNYQTVRLANNNIWHEDLGANYVGQVNITSEDLVEETPEVPTTPEINNPVVEEENTATNNNTNNTNNSQKENTNTNYNKNNKNNNNKTNNSNKNTVQNNSVPSKSFRLKIYTMDKSNNQQISQVNLTLRTKNGENIFTWVSNNAPFYVYDLTSGDYEIIANNSSSLNYESEKEVLEFTIKETDNVEREIVYYLENKNNNVQNNTEVNREDNPVNSTKNENNSNNTNDANTISNEKQSWYVYLIYYIGLWIVIYIVVVILKKRKKK